MFHISLVTVPLPCIPGSAKVMLGNHGNCLILVKEHIFNSFTKFRLHTFRVYVFNRTILNYCYAPVYPLDGTVMVEKEVDVNPQLYFLKSGSFIGISLYTLCCSLLLDPVIICGHP